MKEREHQDLLVAIWTDPTPGFYSAVAWDEFGRSTPPVQLRMPFDDRRFIDCVDRLDELGPDELRYVGARLFDSLFQGDLLRLYIHLREQAQPTETRLRIRLKIDPQNVARLPWECLYDTRRATFLGHSSETTLVRFHEPEKEPASVPLELPLKVLLAAEFADPKDAPRVRQEAAAVREALKRLEPEGLVSVREAGRGVGEEGLTRDRLMGLLQRDVDVVYLLTSCSWSSGEARIGLVDDRGRADHLRPKELSDLFLDGSARLMVLGGDEAVAGVGLELAGSLLAHLPALLALGSLKTEDLAVRFIEGFYRALASMKPVDACLSEARREVGDFFPVESAWLAPALFVSQKQPAVFHSRAGERVRQVYELSEGRYRRRLRETLNRIWPKPERYQRQLFKWMPRQDPLTSYVHAAEFLGQPRDAAELARRFQRMLVLGGPGSGKSMTLYRLFYDSAQSILSYSAKSPLPIYVSLSDLDPETELLDFVADGFDRKLFQSDLEEGRFLFLMDGLDEMSADSAKRRAGELNRFMRRFSLNRFVAAARRPVPVPLDIPTWFEVLPFAEWEATDFLVEGEAMRVEQARVLFQELVGNLGARGGNPQVLSMARRLWREGASVPPTLGGLFEAFYEMAGQTLSPYVREVVLPGLALRMSRMGRTSLRREHMETVTGEPDKSLDHRFGGGLGSEELVAALNKTRLLRGPHAFSFPNVALQEFLTAYALRSTSSAEVLDLITPAEWIYDASLDDRPLNLKRGPFHGALVFLSGMLQNSSALSEGLMERDLVLASECYHAGGSPGTVTEPLRAAIQRALASSGEIYQRIGCLCLEATGDAWSVELLERAAGDGELPARVQALIALGNLRSHRSIPLIQAAASERDPNVARAAQDALIRIRAS
jgi:hypothetical protein